MKFSPQSRVWVYQSNRLLDNIEVGLLQEELDKFTAEWLAHGAALAASAEIRYNAFIILMVDESKAPATGCSIDSSVKFLKKLESKHNLDLFNRFNIAYRMDGELVISAKEDFETLVSIEKIGLDTIVFNNMVQTVGELETEWEVPFISSWHNHIFGHLIEA